MRKIKFRAWDRVSEELVGVKTLDFERKKGAVCAVDYSGINGDLKGEWVLEQYTNLKDKNDTDIYEGDIIKIPTHYIFYGTDVDEWNDDYALVEWSEEYGGFFIYSETPLWEVLFEGHPKNGFYHEFPEVAGNIHENPELLEE